jgi:N-acetylmuramoyl-L-alanine amidase
MNLSRILFLLLFFFIGRLQGEAQVEAVRHNTEGGKTRIVVELSESTNIEVKHNLDPQSFILFIENSSIATDKLKELENNPIIKKYYYGGKLQNKQKYIFELQEIVYLKNFVINPKAKTKQKLVIDLYHKNLARAKQMSLHQVKAPISEPPKEPIVPQKSVESWDWNVTNVALNFSETPKSLPSRLFERKCDYNHCRAKTKPASIPTAYKPIKKNIPTKPFIIAIDAGHGGKDPGAIGEAGVYEKDVVLAIAKKLSWLISRESGMKPVLIRGDDTYIDIRERVWKANMTGANLFISIHANAAKNTSAYGSSVHVLSDRAKYGDVWKLLLTSKNSNFTKLDSTWDDSILSTTSYLKIQNEDTEKSSHLIANLILKNLEKVNPILTPHVYKSDFTVLKSWKVPSVLVETDFISNPTREKELLSKKFQSEIAKSIFLGIKEYYKQNGFKSL